MRLNQNQGYQFFDRNTFTGAEKWSDHNENGEMPRAYYGGRSSYGGYYNKYAASAESIHWTDSTWTVAEASICPSGWTLPLTSANDIDGNWTKMFNKEFGFNSGEEDKLEDALAARRFPISLVRAGRVLHDDGRLQSVGTVSAYSTKQAERVVNIQLASDIFRPNAYVYAEMGTSVRCIQKQAN